MIVITTPTGQIGHQVLARVVAAGAPVRVIARDPDRLAPELRARIEVVQGSQTELPTLEKAFAGAHAVFWLTPPNPGAPSIQEHMLALVQPLCAAINHTGVGRVVAVSSLGRHVAKHAGLISAIFAMDDLIESTGVHYRSLQPPGFMENVLRQLEPITRNGVFTAATPGDSKQPSCATRDIAAVAAGLLLDDSWTGQEDVPLPGPEDLSPRDMADILADVLGRAVRFEQLSTAAVKASLLRRGIAERYVQGMIDMTEAVDRGIYAAPPGTRRDLTPTTFRQWCEDVLKPLAAA